MTRVILSGMQNKKRFLFISVILVIVVGMVVYTLYSRGSSAPAENIVKNVKSEATSPKDATYNIDDRSVTLIDGVSVVPADPGSSSTVTTRYFGNEVTYDFDGDGRMDTVFILTQNTGGSGTFYYVVASLNMARGYIGSNGFLLGDRIAPQTTEMSQNPSVPDVIVVNYADRKVGEPFTIQPSVGKSVWLKLDLKTMQFVEVAQNPTSTINTTTIMVPKDINAYGDAMNKYVFDGGTNPASWWIFVKQTIAIPPTINVIKASAQAAAEQIQTQSGKPGAVVEYFKIIDGTAYILLHMHIDGWAGVSVSLAKIEPLIEKTLLQFPEIKTVKFSKAPGDII